MAGRPYEFPSPNDRSVNNPHITVERDSVLGLYNQSNQGEPAKNLSETVRSWFKKEAYSLGWNKTDFIEDTAILGAKVSISQD